MPAAFISCLKFKVSVFHVSRFLGFYAYGVSGLFKV